MKRREADQLALFATDARTMAEQGMVSDLQLWADRIAECHELVAAQSIHPSELVHERCGRTMYWCQCRRG